MFTKHDSRNTQVSILNIFFFFGGGGGRFLCCSSRENHSIDVSITDVGLILTNLGWFQLFSTCQKKSKFNFDLFWKENQFFGFPCCGTCEDLSIDVGMNYYCTTDIDEARAISFLGTDTVLESSYGNMSAHKKNSQLKAQN